MGKARDAQRGRRNPTALPWGLISALQQNFGGHWACPDPTDHHPQPCICHWTCTGTNIYIQHLYPGAPGINDVQIREAWPSANFYTLLRFGWPWISESLTAGPAASPAEASNLKNRCWKSSGSTHSLSPAAVFQRTTVVSLGGHQVSR